MIFVLLILLVSYLLGSIPTSILAARLLRGIDIRQHGSGNAGATNVFRVLGPGPGVVVMLIDMLKGVIAVALMAFVVRSLGVEAPAFLGSWGEAWLLVAAGAAAVIGHIYTIYAGFKGGKGVATGAGVVVALAPVPVLVGTVLFFLIVALTRYVSLGSILAAISLPLTQIVRHLAFGIDIPVPIMWFCALIPLLILYTHRANLVRLLRGTESRIGTPKAG